MARIIEIEMKLLEDQVFTENMSPNYFELVQDGDEMQITFIENHKSFRGVLDEISRYFKYQKKKNFYGVLKEIDIDFLKLIPGKSRAKKMIYATMYFLRFSSKNSTAPIWRVRYFLKNFEFIDGNYRTILKRRDDFFVINKMDDDKGYTVSLTKTGVAEANKTFSSLH